MKTPEQELTPAQKHFRKINKNADYVMKFVLGGLFAYLIFIMLLFQTDSPQFWSWWEGRENTPNDFSTHSHFKSIYYDKSTNNLTIQIYNGNYFSFIQNKNQCNDFIEEYQTNFSDLFDKLSTFYVSITCSMEHSTFNDRHEIINSIIVPFNSTSEKLTVDFSFPCNIQECLCNLILYTNYLSKIQNKCFIVFKEPTISNVIDPSQFTFYNLN